MKTIIALFVCVTCSAWLCHAAPSPTPLPTPSGWNEITPSNIELLTLEFSDSGPGRITFHAAGNRYSLPVKLIYDGPTSHAEDIIAQFRIAKSISVLTTGGVGGPDGVQEFPVHRIQFHY